jgi:hypothetical protein
MQLSEPFICSFSDFIVHCPFTFNIATRVENGAGGICVGVDGIGADDYTVVILLGGVVLLRSLLFGRLFLDRLWWIV